MLVTLEDGSGQVYSAVELVAAVQAVMSEPDGWDEPCGYWPTEPAPVGVA